MTDEETFEQIVLPKVLANHQMCRQYLHDLHARGAEFNFKIEDLTHDACIDVILAIYTNIKRSETLGVAIEPLVDRLH